MPHAEMEEILPAARLFSRATAGAPADYDRAKAQFLAGLKDVGLHAQVSLLLKLSYKQKHHCSKRGFHIQLVLFAAL